MENFSAGEIERYYDLSQSHYEKFWDLKHSRALHYGYWDADTKNFSAALANINRILSQKAGIQKNFQVLDAGCGVGGSSLWLAKNIGCHVTGISLSAKQVTQANAFANRESLNELAAFEQKDFTATGFGDHRFDIVWAIESVCHAADKRKFIKEAFRLLKPGGRLIMADFFAQPGLSGNDAAIVQRWANGWAIDAFAVLKDFTNQLGDAGFINVVSENATANILPSAKRLYRAWFAGAAGGFMYRLFHPRATAFGKRNIDTAWLQYHALKKSLWTYEIISAKKP